MTMTARNTDRLWLPDRMSRRDAFKVGGGLAIAAGLSACGVGNGSGTVDEAATERAIEPKIDGDLVYFNYAQYVDPALVKQFV
jgi:spermidine/putrescine transport system substrate-binding protein